MSRHRSTRFALAALTLTAGVHVTNPTSAQNINDLLTIFGGDRQRGARQARAEWRRLPPAEIACIDQRLRRKGSSVDSLVRRGVKPSAARLIELRSSCRQFVESVQTDTTQRDAAGSPTSTAHVSNSIEPKDADVAPPPPAEPTKDAGVAPPPPAEPTKGAGVTLPLSGESVGRVAEERAQQGNVELEDRHPERPITEWLAAAFLFAVVAIAALLGIVIYLLTRWRNAGQKTVALSLLKTNSEVGAEKGLLNTAIGENELVMPLADRMIPDQIVQGATTSLRQGSAYSNNLESAGEVGPNTVSIEGSAADGSAVEDVAQLAKLYAMGTPSEQEFQLLKDLIPQGDFQKPKVE
jgi:hypothetical protein